MTFEQGFREELEKLALHPGAVLLAADLGLAGIEGGHGVYKAVRHGKAPVATRLPYNPMYLAPWAGMRGLHAVSAPLAQSESLPAKVVGRTGLAASKLWDAALQIDPINAVGGLIHSGVDWARKKKQPMPSDFVVRI
jgi:hypothetical protein